MRTLQRALIVCLDVAPPRAIRVNLRASGNYGLLRLPHKVTLRDRVSRYPGLELLAQDDFEVRQFLGHSATAHNTCRGGEVMNLLLMVGGGRRIGVVASGRSAGFSWRGHWEGLRLELRNRMCNHPLAGRATYGYVIRHQPKGLIRRLTGAALTGPKTPAKRVKHRALVESRRNLLLFDRLSSPAGLLNGRAPHGC